MLHCIHGISMNTGVGTLRCRHTQQHVHAWSALTSVCVEEEAISYPILEMFLKHWLEARLPVSHDWEEKSSQLPHAGAPGCDGPDFTVTWTVWPVSWSAFWKEHLHILQVQCESANASEIESFPKLLDWYSRIGSTADFEVVYSWFVNKTVLVQDLLSVSFFCLSGSPLQCAMKSICQPIIEGALSIGICFCSKNSFRHCKHQLHLVNQWCLR